MNNSAGSVCFIASNLFQGGFTTSLLSMIHQLEMNGYSVDLLLLSPERNTFNNQEYLNINDFEVLKPIGINEELYRIYRKNRDHIDLHFLDKQIKCPSVPDLRQLKIKRVQLASEYHVLMDLPCIDMSAYDCVVSWEELTCNDFLALNVKAKRKIGYIHPDYKTAGFDKSSDISVLKRLDAVVGVSESTANTLKQVFTELKERITYVPNVLDPEAVLSKAKEEVSTFEKSAFDIVTVCRLDIYTKGLDRIVRVAKMLDDHGIKYQWYIIGDGNDQKQLAQMIEQYSTINVHLLGSKDNPYPYVYNADLFVLLSNYEGRPMAVDEAIILGTPVLVTNYASAREQVDNTAGFVVEMNDDSIYEQLRLIIDKTSLKKQKRKQTNRSDLSKFTDVSRMVALLRGSAND